ncbi:hypothetical protein HMPREF2955_07020 [Prevotella sp. HMSC073D09]|uniref:hypothetical protein n=1 Tax=Prevotella sp. HMSC073D09 TaxID=1739459 RepID=UPI0008A43DC0|nr:hypothetical protein [Prevotella sp. HMSC073D09]OFQ23422.1 hypothetical protein HMPREF2955_07020 [Prevotella sp. HMSC073D09]
MQLRKEIEPDFKTVEKSYPIVLKAIMSYTAYCDENGDEDLVEYNKLADYLHQLTGKDMSQFNLREWWEEEGAEVLAFRIVLPEPQCVHNITMDELYEVVKRLKTDIYTPSEDGSLKELFKYHLDEYYKLFLERNFNTYDPKLFERNINDKGEYFEYTEAQIVQMLWR